MIRYVPSDKGTHYIYTQALCLIFYVGFLVTIPAHAVVLALICTVVVAIGVERYQGHSGTGHEDRWDALWGICGGVSSFLALWMTNYLQNILV